MPAIQIRDLRLETLEDRQMMHASSLAADAPNIPADADAYVRTIEVEDAEKDECTVAVDACFEETEESDEHQWTAAAWAGLAFCVSSALNQTVLSRTTDGYVFDLRKLGRKHDGYEGSVPTGPVC